MKEYKDDKKFLRGAFPKSLQGAKGTGDSVADLGSFRSERQLYAVTSDQETARRFKLITRDGSVWSVSYSLLPVFILTGGKQLAIRTSEMEAVIHGRNLSVIEDYLSDEHLLWLRESPSGKDDGESHVFIEEVKIWMIEK